MLLTVCNLGFPGYSLPGTWGSTGHNSLLILSGCPSESINDGMTSQQYRQQVHTNAFQYHRYWLGERPCKKKRFRVGPQLLRTPAENDQKKIRGLSYLHLHPINREMIEHRGVSCKWDGRTSDINVEGPSHPFSCSKNSQISIQHIDKLLITWTTYHLNCPPCFHTGRLSQSCSSQC